VLVLCYMKGVTLRWHIKGLLEISRVNVTFSVSSDQHECVSAKDIDYQMTSLTKMYIASTPSSS